MTDKENSSPTRMVASFPWRSSSSTLEEAECKQNGFSPVISASSFYANRRQLPGSSQLSQLHAVIQKTVVTRQKRSVRQRQQMQWKAYEQVTSFRSNFPLQEPALKYFKKLMKEYCKEESIKNVQKTGDEVSGTADADTEGTISALITPASPFSLDTSASTESCGDDEEFFKGQFISERDLSTVPHTAVSSFLPVLWSMEPRVFCMENATGGGHRKYVVGAYGRFAHHYWRDAPRHPKCYYELIRDQTPCRLYLDLEFARTSNPEISSSDAEELLCELWEELVDELCDQYECLSRHELSRSRLVDLDSSTHKKFSRHWIVHLPESYLFAHTAAVGHFVKQHLIARLANEFGTGQLRERNRPLLQKYLMVNVPESNVNQHRTTCFVDTGVYTRNRLFRLLGSSKCGKPATAALRIADANQFPFHASFTNDSFYLPDMKKKANLQRQADEAEKCSSSGYDTDAILEHFCTVTDWTHHAEALANTLVIPVNASKTNLPILPFDEDEPARMHSSLGIPRRSATNASSTAPSYGPSPFPGLDKFVANVLAQRKGLAGQVRCWNRLKSESSDTDIIQFQMARNRYCERLGRAHRSNNVYWCIDLTPTERSAFYAVQACHDPECQGFRGRPVSIPTNVCEEIQQVVLDEALAELPEEELETSTLNKRSPVPIIEEEEDSSSENEGLTDDALYEAIAAHPELFP